MKQTLKYHFWPVFLLLTTFGTYFSSMFSRIIQLDATGLSTNLEHVWSDWPFHIAIAANFAYKSPADWFLHHPMYGTGTLTYPFLTDFISGMLMRMNIPVTLAFIVPSIIFSFLLLIGSYILFYQITKVRSVATIAIIIFLLSSGLGFTKYFSSTSVPPIFISREDIYSWYEGNVILGMLIPQRAFLLGMTMAVWSLCGYLYGMTSKTRAFFKCILLFSGLLYGLLAITHIHSVIATLPFIIILSLTRPSHWKQSMLFLLPAGIVGISLFLSISAFGIENKHMISFMPGWTAKDGLAGWIFMWVILWGGMIPLVLTSLVTITIMPTIIRTWIFSFLFVFLLANLILFQPIPWDNAKLFMWCYFGFSVLAAWILTLLFKINIITKLIAVAIFGLLIATGSIELFRFSQSNSQYQLSSSEDIAFGTQVRYRTDPNGIFLTSPITNHPVMIWGARPIFVGFIGWVYNFGFLPDQKIADTPKMFAGNTTLLKQYNISYVVIGPYERHDYAINEEALSKFPLAVSTDNYKIYDVRNIP